MGSPDTGSAECGEVLAFLKEQNMMDLKSEVTKSWRALLGGKWEARLQLHLPLSSLKDTGALKVVALA